MTDLNVEGMALAPGVVETIVSIAVGEVEGVASVGPSSASGLRSVFASKPATQGIGYALPDLAANVRKAVADAVASQVGASVGAVDVYVDGIQFAR